MNFVVIDKWHYIEANSLKDSWHIIHINAYKTAVQSSKSMPIEALAFHELDVFKTFFSIVIV